MAAPDVIRGVTTREGRPRTRAVRRARRRRGRRAAAIAVAALAGIAGLAWTWSTAEPVAGGEPDTAIAPGTGSRGQASWIAAELVVLVGGAAIACAWHGRRQRRRRADDETRPGTPGPPDHEQRGPDASPTGAVIDLRPAPDPAPQRDDDGRAGRSGRLSRYAPRIRL